MDNEVRDLWTEVGNKCLQRASELLDDKTASAAATAETVKCLVETAISMDMRTSIMPWRPRRIRLPLSAGGARA